MANSVTAGTAGTRDVPPTGFASSCASRGRSPGLAAHLVQLHRKVPFHSKHLPVTASGFWLT
jgi:hypothetical protein